MGKKIRLIYRNKDFLFLLSSELISTFGDVFFYTAISWLAFSMTNSTFSVSLLNIADLIPTLLFVMVISIFIDRSNQQRKIMMSIYLIQGIITAALCILVMLGYLNIGMVFIFIFLNSAAASGKNPLINKILVHINHGELAEMNTLLTTGKRIISVIGSLLAGFCADYISFIVFIDFITFILSFILISRINYGEMTSENEETSVLQDTKEIKNYLKTNKNLTWFLLLSFSVSTASLSVMIAFPSISENILKMGSEGYGLLNSVANFSGMVILFLFPVIDKLTKRLEVLIILLGVFTIAFGLSSHILFVLICLMLFEIISALMDVSLPTILQTIISEQMIGRMFGIITILSIVSSIIGQFVFGYLIDHFNTSFILTIAGIYCIFIAFIIKHNMDKFPKLKEKAIVD